MRCLLSYTNQPNGPQNFDIAKQGQWCVLSVCLCVYAFVCEFVHVFWPECVLVCAVRCFAFYVMVVEVVVEA